MHTINPTPEEQKEFPTEGGDHEGNENQLWNNPENEQNNTQVHPDYEQDNGEFTNFNQSKRAL